MEAPIGVVILDRIPVKLEVDRVIKQMRLHGDTRRYESHIRELIDIVTPIARPKAVYKVGCIDKKGQDSLEIEGVKFTSQLLRDTLDRVETVFVGIATCGTEVESIEIPASDVMRRFSLDAIKIALVIGASNYLQEQLTQRFGLGTISTLNPGELKSFPIEEQRKLFQILGDVEGMIGVRLTENCAMVPTKSRAGIFFSSETQFISCRMCKQGRCIGRRAAYDPELAKQYEVPSKSLQL
jgi:hypothetical protein